MKRNCILNVIIVIVLVLLTVKAFSQNTIEVTVKNIKEVTGSIRVGLFNDEEKFLKTPIKGEIVKTSAKTMKIIFKDLPNGTYAVSVIHDENENEKLDTGFMGIPKEGFGFSNDAMGTFGPPKYKEASFTLPDAKQVSVTLKYM